MAAPTANLTLSRICLRALVSAFKPVLSKNGRTG